MCVANVFIGVNNCWLADRNINGNLRERIHKKLIMSDWLEEDGALTKLKLLRVSFLSFAYSIDRETRRVNSLRVFKCLKTTWKSPTPTLKLSATSTKGAWILYKTMRLHASSFAVKKISKAKKKHSQKLKLSRTKTGSTIRSVPRQCGRQNQTVMTTLAKTIIERYNALVLVLRRSRLSTPETTLIELWRMTHIVTDAKSRAMKIWTIPPHNYWLYSTSQRWNENALLSKNLIHPNWTRGKRPSSWCQKFKHLMKFTPGQTLQTLQTT